MAFCMLSKMMETEIPKAGETTAANILVFLNALCLVAVFGTLIGIKIAIATTGDLSARWIFIRYSVFFVTGGLVWLTTCLSAIGYWIRGGNEKTLLRVRLAAFSLPVCTVISLAL